MSSFKKKLIFSSGESGSTNLQTYSHHVGLPQPPLPAPSSNKWSKTGSNAVYDPPAASTSPYTSGPSPPSCPPRCSESASPVNSIYRNSPSAVSFTPEVSTAVSQKLHRDASESPLREAPTQSSTSNEALIVIGIHFGTT